MARFAVGLSLILLCVVSFSFAQSDPSAGIQLFSTNDFGIDLATSNINIQIAGRSKAGKLPFSNSFVGNSHAYFKSSTQWAVNETFGIHVAPLVAVTGTLTGTCPSKKETNIAIVDGTGAVHPLPAAAQINVCPGYYSGGTWYTSDGSGYTFVSSNGTAVVYDANGVENTVSGILNGYNASLTATDPDGASVFLNTTSDEWIDSFGVPALTVGSNGNNITTYSYQNGSGGTSEYSVTYDSTALPILTNFNCNGISEYSSVFQPTTSLTMPDNSEYQFTYEQTPGKSGDYTKRIASITLPAGGSISYGYSDSAMHNGINCTSGVVPMLTVTVKDNNGNTNKWTYVNNNGNSPSACAPGVGPCNFTVVKTDPALNQTVYTFSGEFQTEVAYYQGGCPTNINGCNGSGTELRFTTTCYNGHLTSLSVCQTLTTPPTLPIKQTDVYTWVGMTAQALTETIYDCNTAAPCYGLVTEVKKYAYGAAIPPTGTPLSDTAIVYNSGSTCGTLSQYINSRPCSITVTGPSGQASQTNYTYNAGGHPTQTQQWVSSTAPFLISSAVYGGSNAAPGVLSSVMDVNNATSTYSSFVCNGMLPTTITYPLSLSASQTWDSTCAGGVLESITDPNQNSTSYNYADPLWRMTSGTNQNYPSTTLSYPSVTQFESSMNFNSSNSTTDTTTTTDGLGRTILVQKLQAPGTSTYDSVQTKYGWTSGVGAFSKVSMPYSAAAGGSGTIFTTTQYDALGRPSTVTDLDSGTVTYSYNGNDVLQAVASPSVQKQFEYDAVGNLTSVCEITNASGSGSCGQTNPQTGFLTKYTYNGLGKLLTVTQNAQPGAIGGTQTRSYSYDGLGRLTQEVNPESGTTKYFWDSAPSACGSGGWSTAGDLGAKEDNANVYTCYGYDGLHRLMGFLHVPSSTCTVFNYDSATPPSGISVSNTQGRLINAYTNSACNGRASLITDMWFGYSPRGEVTDIYSSTPNSAGYYHLGKSYWANGAVETLSGIPGVPTITYGADGEGRTSTVKAGSQNLVTATSYNPASQVIGVTFGSTDSDTYQYDPNTGRMTKYTFSVNGSSVVGNLTWNSNATLSTLAITDPFNSGNQQTCTYGYDKLARINSVSCGSVWAQTFSFDPFGNITKTGSITWQPTYASSPTNNQYLAGWNGVRYDADGRLTQDPFHTYQWDANGRPTMIDTNHTQTFDAFNYLTESNQSGSIYQYLHDIDGSLLGNPQAQSAGYSVVPLSGGARAIYNQGTFQGYMHMDWLGTARLTSNSSRTVTSDVEAAPYGEPYPPPAISLGVFAGMEPSLKADLYDGVYREYHPTQGRWISPDPAGLAAVDVKNPQSWNRYAYVLNNPLSSIDPTGLDCIYLNDSGTGVDDNGIDHSSNVSECGSNGGYWIEGTVNSDSWLTINSDSGLVSGFGLDSNGNAEFSVAGAEGSNAWGAWTQTFGTGVSSDTLSGAANNGMYFAGVLPPGMNGPAIYAKWATRGRPPTNFPTPQNPIWPQGAPPEINPPVLPSDVPWYKAIPALLMELLDNMNIDIPVMVDPCLMAPSAQCGPYAPPQA